jgi:hypothetical protein
VPVRLTSSTPLLVSVPLPSVPLLPPSPICKVVPLSMPVPPLQASSFISC